MVSKTLNKFLDDNKLEVEVEDHSKNICINKVIKDMELKLKRDKDVKVIAIGNIKNISDYILIKSNYESIEASTKGNRAKNYKSEVIFTGLRQPIKTIDINTYKILHLFIKRFKVSNIDICFDGLSDIAINDKNKNKLNWLFKDYINNHNETKIEKTSFYLNKPIGIDRDTDYFKRVLVYKRN